MSKTQEAIPKPIQGDAVVQKLIRETLWRPAKRKNDWRVFLIVGREGTGKSLTCASILKSCDPDFGVEDTHFEPVEFLEDISEGRDQSGKAVMLDEAGVGFGNRTWQDREQVEANQALQTARDDNMIVGLTLPRLEELDKQLKGRIHALLETTKLSEGSWVEVKWKIMDPSRSGADKVYKPYPKMVAGNSMKKIKRVRVGPPPEDFIVDYQKKKAKWKDDLFDRVIGRYEPDGEDEGEAKLTGPKQIASDIVDQGNIEDYVGEYNSRKFIDEELIELDYDVGGKKSKQVKKAIEREVEL